MKISIKNDIFDLEKVEAIILEDVTERENFKKTVKFLWFTWKEDYFERKVVGYRFCFCYPGGKYYRSTTLTHDEAKNVFGELMTLGKVHKIPLKKGNENG